jgi:hypothetical protein
VAQLGIEFEAGRNTLIDTADVEVGVDIHQLGTHRTGTLVPGVAPAAPTLGAASASGTTATVPVTLPAGATGVARLMNDDTGALLATAAVSGGAATFTGLAAGLTVHIAVYAVLASLPSTPVCSNPVYIQSTTSTHKAIMDRVAVLIRNLAWSGWTVAKDVSVAWTPNYAQEMDYPNCIVCPGNVSDDVPDRTNAEFEEIYPVRVYLANHAHGREQNMDDLLLKREQVKELFKGRWPLVAISGVFHIDVVPFAVVDDPDVDSKRLSVAGVLLNVHVNQARA